MVLAMDIGGTQLKSGLVQRNGKLTERLIVPSHASEGKTALLNCLNLVIDDYMKLADRNGWSIRAIGIGSAGYLDRNGRVLYATDNIPGWTGLDLRGYIEEQTGLPVEAVNDVYAITAGEAWAGAGKGYERFLCVALGTGIGGCIWEKGEPYRGDAGFAGALGHQVVEMNGRLCTCGQRGCWEAYASVSVLRKELGTSFLARNEQTLPDGGFSRDGAASPEGDPKLLFDSARSGHKQANKIIERYARNVAIGLMNAMYTLDIQKVVIAGAISQQGPFLTDQIRTKIIEMANPLLIRDGLEIVPAILGNDAGIYGAARMAIKYIQD